MTQNVLSGAEVKVEVAICSLHCRGDVAAHRKGHREVQPSICEPILRCAVEVHGSRGSRGCSTNSV